MKDKIIKMGDSEIILSYDSKTKLISVDSDSLGTIVGNIAGNVVGAIEGDVHDGIGGFVGNSIDGNVMGSIGGIVFDDVFEVRGKVGTVVGGKKMKDKIIKMGDNEIIVSYDEKTKLINVSCIVGHLGDVFGDVMYVSGCVGEVGFNVGVLGGNVTEVGGNVGKVGGKIGSVIE